MANLQKYKKNEKNKEKITKHPCARINKLEYKALWNPQGLLDAVMLCERAPEQIEIVGKAVQPHQHDGIRAVFFIGTQRGTLGTPADGAADMAERDGAIPAGVVKFTAARKAHTGLTIAGGRQFSTTLRLKLDGINLLAELPVGLPSQVLLARPDIDGGLVGGASLKAPDFLQIIAAAR